MYIFNECPSFVGTATNLKKAKNKNLRFECILQTAGDVNINRRRYNKGIIEEGISKINERVASGGFVGELDHPIDKEPSRQITVLYSEASHRILEMFWDGNKLKGVLETLRTPKGEILKNLAEDGIPVGFSFRGMGELKEIRESGNSFFEVCGPLHIVTWDSVSYPSHREARIIKITEAVQSSLVNNSFIHESSGIIEEDGLICTKEGFCYLPNHFDKMVEERVVKLVDKFSV